MRASLYDGNQDAGQLVNNGAAISDLSRRLAEVNAELLKIER